MAKKYYLTSNEKTCWDSIPEELLSPLDSFIKSEYKFNCDLKHNDLKFSRESIPLNDKQIHSCPYCGSDSFVKNGFTKNGIQKFLCKNCKKGFTPTTSTLMEYHKLALEQHIEYLLNLFRYQTLNSLGHTNKNSRSTSRYWLEKVFISLRNYQDNLILSGEIYFDETYISKVKKYKFDKAGNKIKEHSITQYCIGIACDKNYVYARVENLGKPSFKSTEKCFEGHFKPGSMLIHDSEVSHKILFRKHAFINCQYNASKQLKGLKDKENPMQPINDQCRFLKMFLKRHSSFDREHLQDYLNLFCFIQNPPRDLLQKAKILLNASYLLSQTLKYRDFYSKKPKIEQ